MIINSYIPRWDEQASCSLEDPELFFPQKGSNANAAKRICAECIVRNECLEYALKNSVEYGVWGGYTEDERKAILSKRRLLGKSAITL